MRTIKTGKHALVPIRNNLYAIIECANQRRIGYAWQNCSHLKTATTTTVIDGKIKMHKTKNWAAAIIAATCEDEIIADASKRGPV